MKEVPKDPPLKPRKGGAYFASGLWSAQHYQAMGDAVFLFGWLVDRQTKRNGLVLGGKPLSYAMIEADRGFPARTVETWMARLRKCGYVRVTHTSYKRMVIRVLNPKKFKTAQVKIPFQIPPANGNRIPPASGEYPAGQRDSTIERSKRDQNRVPKSREEQAAPLHAEWEELRTKLFGEPEAPQPKLSIISRSAPEPQVPVFRSIEEMRKWEESRPKPKRLREQQTGDVEQEIELDEEALELVLEAQD